MPALTPRPTTTPNSPPSRLPWAAEFDAYEPSLAVAKRQVEGFVEAMQSGATPRWLTLSGVNGCGKTMLARQVLRQAMILNPGNPATNPIWPPGWETNRERVHIFRRPYCIWLDEQAFAARLRGGDYSIVDDLRDDFFLGFDDLGAARDPSNFLSDKLATLAERRLNRWTIWTTNLTVAEIAERIDARLASRLVRAENVVVRLTARDYALSGRGR